jgi:hypothetical protein
MKNIRQLAGIVIGGAALLGGALAQQVDRVVVKNDVFSSTIPADPGWKQIGSGYLSMTYQWQDAEHSRSWNIRFAGAQIRPVKGREELVREFLDASKGLSAAAMLGAEVGPTEVLPAKARRYECVEGMTRPSPTTTMPMTVKFKVALCRHPAYPNGAVIVAMSVGGRTGDDAQLDGFDRLVDDLVMK